ncbi:hypothetical protein PIB30_089397, partial [Stylosanthes scabra]|nr:hypothetical protein [Stylosanthes scabra]
APGPISTPPPSYKSEDYLPSQAGSSSDGLLTCPFARGGACISSTGAAIRNSWAGTGASGNKPSISGGIGGPSSLP